MTFCPKLWSFQFQPYKWQGFQAYTTSPGPYLFMFLCSYVDICAFGRSQTLPLLWGVLLSGFSLRMCLGTSVRQCWLCVLPECSLPGVSLWLINTTGPSVLPWWSWTDPPSLWALPEWGHLIGSHRCCVDTAWEVHTVWTQRGRCTLCGGTPTEGAATRQALGASSGTVDGSTAASQSLWHWQPQQWQRPKALVLWPSVVRPRWCTGRGCELQQPVCGAHPRSQQQWGQGGFRNQVGGWQQEPCTHLWCFGGSACPGAGLDRSWHSLLWASFGRACLGQWDTQSHVVAQGPLSRATLVLPTLTLTLLSLGQEVGAVGTMWALP
jgi:hypothetical protein